MSKVYDQDRNIVNAPAPQTTDGAGKNRYSEDGLTIDWFATHPRPVAVITDRIPEPVFPPYEDENGKRWLHNPVTCLWDIPETTENLGDATKTDAALTEVANEIAPSNSDGASV